MSHRFRLLRWPLALLARWLTPRTTDPEESFRESAIRVIYPLLVSVRPVIIWYRHIVQAKPVPRPLSVGVLYGLWAGLALLSLVMLLRKKIVLSALFLLLIQTHADIIGIVVNGYWEDFTQMTLMIDVLSAALLLPASFLVPYTLFLASTYGILAHLPSGFWHPALPVSTTTEPESGPTMGTAVLGATLLYVAALAGFARVEVDKRRRALQEMVATLEDRVKERTVELTAANEQLRALSRVKDEFVANVSHELRSPITNLKVQQHLMAVDPAGFDEHLAVARRETDRLNRIIEDLLRLSRLDQEQVELSLTSLDLNGLASQYVTDRQMLAESKGLKLSFAAQPDLPAVRADEGLLGQVLSILLTNAFNYTPAGGSVAVRTQAREEDGQLWAGFSVSDSGPGISPQEQPRLFERFFRGKVGRESGEPGTGLGLAVVREIVERHKGRVEVKSGDAAGEGATFSVWLPGEG